MGTCKTPIISSHMRNTLLAELLKTNPNYYHTTKLIMETGCTLKFLREMTCGDFRRSRQITYVLKRAENPWKETIPQDTYDDILQFTIGKSDEMPLFSARRLEQSMHQSSYLRTLDAVAYRLGFTDGITVNSLRMCYLYDLVKKDGNVIRAKQYLKAHSIREVYEALGIDSNTDKITVSSPISVFVRMTELEKLKAETNYTLRECIRRCQNLSSLSKKDAIRYLRYIEALRSALDTYKIGQQGYQFQEKQPKRI